MKLRDIHKDATYSDGKESRRIVLICPHPIREKTRVTYRLISGPRKHQEYSILLTTFCRFALIRCNLSTPNKFMEPAK